MTYSDTLAQALRQGAITRAEIMRVLGAGSVQTTNLAGEYKDLDGFVENLRQALGVFGLVLTEDPDFAGECDSFAFILSNRPLSDDEVHQARMFSDREEDEDEQA